MPFIISLHLSKFLWMKNQFITGYNYFSFNIVSPVLRACCLCQKLQSTDKGENVFSKYSKNNRFLLSNILLLCSQLFLVFFFFIFDQATVKSFVSTVMLTTLFVSGIFTITLSQQRKLSGWMIPFFVNIPILWMNFFLDNSILENVNTFCNLVLFFLITVNLLLKLIRSKKVDSNVLLEAVNGYFLLGIMGAIIFAYILRNSPGAFTFEKGMIKSFHDFIYFSFITFTSIGFGDISPVTPLAKSATMFFGVAGQLYTTFIIAFLVGKMSNKH